MAPKLKPKGSLKRLARQAPSSEQTMRTLDALMRGNRSTEVDRAVAIVGGSILENYLKDAILTHFIEMEEQEINKLFDGQQGGPLSTFSGKIRIAHALGITNDFERADLDCIRTVRNAFAHAILHVSFRTPAIVQECKKLYFRHSRSSSAKSRYIITLSVLAGKLQGYAEARITLGARPKASKIIS